VVVDEPTQAAIAVGKILPTPVGESPWAMVTPADDLLAIYEPHHPGNAKPSVVLPTS
jgi:hypothetical protein